MLKRTVSVVMLCAFAASPAVAGFYGTTNVSFSDYGPGLTLEITTAQDAWSAAVWGGDPETRSAYTGLSLLQTTALDGTGGVPLPPDAHIGFGGIIAAFCLDLYDQKPAVVPSSTYNAVSLDLAPDRVAANNGMGSAKAQQIARILQTYDYRQSDEAAAAAQLAIWEILDENHSAFSQAVDQWDVTAGDFRVIGSAEVADMANDILDTIAGSDVAHVDFSGYIAISSSDSKGGYQDFVAVPAPAALLLGMLGLSAAGLGLRRVA